MSRLRVLLLTSICTILFLAACNLALSSRRQLAVVRATEPFEAPPPKDELEPLLSLAWQDSNLTRPEGGSSSLHCQSLMSMKPKVRSIAVVGNGPLSARQRQQIEATDVVMRFNKMNNRYCGERLDIWVVRFAQPAKHGFHGIGETVNCGTGEAFATARSLWFLDAAGSVRREKLSKVLKKFPRIRQRVWVPIDNRPLNTHFKTVVSSKAAASSGWHGIELALQCAPPGARVHVFGFNWSRKHWSGHSMDAEEQYAVRTMESGRVFIHWPVCTGLRTCGGCAIVASYDEKRGYTCAPIPGQEGNNGISAA